MSRGQPADLANGYHWFRLDEGTTFVALLEEGRTWYVPGVGNPVDPFDDAIYLRPVEPAPHH